MLRAVTDFFQQARDTYRTTRFFAAIDVHDVAFRLWHWVNAFRLKIQSRQFPVPLDIVPHDNR